MDKFDIVTADFPWTYTSFGTAKLPYQCMTPEQLKNFPIGEFLTKRSILFLWVTSPHLYGLQKECVDYWSNKYSLYYKGVSFLWVKTKKDGTPVGSRGPRATITKATFEMCVAFSPVKKGRPMPVMDETVPSVVLAPVEAHSKKPVEVLNRINKMYPTATKLELFGRGAPKEGWSIWGDEAQSTVDFTYET